MNAASVWVMGAIRRRVADYDLFSSIMRGRVAALPGLFGP